MDESLCNPSQYIGCLWRLQTRREGTVEGILKDYFPGNDSFTFDKAERKESDDEESEYLGVLGLFRHEILSAAVIDCDEDVRRKYLQVHKPTINKTLNDEDYHISKRDLQSEVSDEDSIETLSESDDEIVSLCDINEDDFNVEFHIQTNNWKAPFSDHLTFIDSSTNEDSVSSVLMDIKKMKAIGIAAIGENISRFGFIDCLLISTDNGNYIFCEDTWISRLKDVLQTTNIMKIIHGCGFFADTLLRKYKIRIQNVWDTQILDFFIRQRDKNKKRKAQQPTLYSYRKCLREYLGIVVPAVFSRKNFSRLKASHPSDAFDIFLKMRIMPMKQLRWIQMERFLEEVKFGTELCIRGLSEASDAEYEVLKQNVCTLISQRRVDFPGLSLPESSIYSEEHYFDKTYDVDISMFKNVLYKQQPRSSVNSLLSVKQLSRHLETINQCRSVAGYLNGHANVVEELSESGNGSSETSPQTSRSSSVEAMSSDSDDVVYVTRGFTAIQPLQKDLNVEWPQKHTRREPSIEVANNSHLFRPAGSECTRPFLPQYNSLHFNDFYC